MRALRILRWPQFAAAGVLLGAVCALIGQVSAQTGAMPKASRGERLAGRGVKIPLEYDDEGRIKSVVHAEKATLPDADGEIKAVDVMMSFLDYAGSSQGMVVVTDWCRINVSNRTARSDAPIRVDKPGMTITGTGFRWNGGREHIRILNDARVVMARSFVDQKQGGSTAPTTLPGFRKIGY